MQGRKKEESKRAQGWFLPSSDSVRWQFTQAPSLLRKRPPAQYAPVL